MKKKVITFFTGPRETHLFSPSVVTPLRAGTESLRGRNRRAGRRLESLVYISIFMILRASSKV